MVLINIAGFALVRGIIEIYHADNENGGDGASDGTDHASYILLLKITFGKSNTKHLGKSNTKLFRVYQKIEI